MLEEERSKMLWMKNSNVDPDDLQAAGPRWQLNEYRHGDEPPCFSMCTEWRAFSTQEKTAWIKAVNCLSHLPHDPALTPTVDPSISQIPPVNKSSSYYDDIVYMHMDLNTRVHFTGLFLPFHRWFLNSFEQALKNKCGYTGVSPYWNWTMDASHFFESSFWSDSDTQSGLGGWGNPKNDDSVADGAFKNLRLSYPVPNTAPRREFTLLPFDYPGVPFYKYPLQEANSSFLPAAIETLLSTQAGNYRRFQEVFEAWEGPHGAVHLIMGGDMAGTCPDNAPNCTPGSTWSNNDPLFWMHHAMVDKIWSDWQQRSPDNAKSFFGGSVQALSSFESYMQYPNGSPPYLNMGSKIPADGMFPEVTIGDVMSTTSGVLCYVYE